MGAVRPPVVLQLPAVQATTLYLLTCDVSHQLQAATGLFPALVRMWPCFDTAVLHAQGEGTEAAQVPLMYI
jgi:hypothetical protein